jgi:predicted phage terminase large subunit-like protein
MRTRAEQKAWQEYLELCQRIESQTAQLIVDETEKQKEKRKKKLLEDPVAFCRYYFQHYIDADFAWFHKKAMHKIADNKDLFAVFEWPREHAKSVLLDVFMALYVYAKGEMTGMMIISSNNDKAKGLLEGLQAEMESNQLWINDYGNLCTFGKWQDGHFVTKDGIGFWAFGRNQSPRGVRVGKLRPNYTVVDDIDDKIIVRNLARVKDMVAYILEDVYGAMPITGSRLLVAGNRIHKKSILAHVVGDIEPGDPKRKGIYHLKVFAIENNRHGKSSFSHGKPAWKERYTLAMLKTKSDKQGYTSFRREFFHEHHEEGHIFRNEWITWRKCHTIRKYDFIYIYCDPSFKDKQKNDYKAIVVVGKKGKYYDVVDAWVRQASIKSMVSIFYDLYDEYENHARYYMEANFMQDSLITEFDNEAEVREYYVPLCADKRVKPPKEVRIENLQPFFERGILGFNEAKRKSPDMLTLIQQFTGFPFAHDDGPDAVEGAIYYLQRRGRASKTPPRSGTYKIKNHRR